MRLIVTRPREDAEALKAKLEELGHSVILSPLLDIVHNADIALPDEHYQFLALTSANGAHALAGHPMLPRLRSLPVLTVGPQSADAARSAGFVDVQATGGDATGLARYIAESRDPTAGAVLYVSGRDSASDFTGLLTAAGFKIARIIAYEAKAAAALATEVRDGADAVLLFSPRTARVWVDLVAKADLERMAMAMIHICISGNTAAALPDAYARRVASVPTEAAMLDIVASVRAR
jgi:uroporphyrinogen-III synthase